MMDFDDFKNRVVAEIREHLPIQYIDADISIKEVIKNNDTKLTGLMISDNSEITPNIYLEGFYERYCNGEGMDTVLDALAECRVSHAVDSFKGLKDIIDFDSIKDRIICKLVNEDYNKEYLSDKPYTKVEDLAVVYAVNIGDGPEGMVSATITNTMLDNYGISKEELHGIALNNLANSEISFRNMTDILKEMMLRQGMPEDIGFFGEAEAIPMYVLTNKSHINGAAAILDKGTMDNIAEKLNGDYIVIPSSVSETIIVPIDSGINSSDLNSMVQDVNSTEVAVEERLSDHVYMYDAVEHELLSPEKYVERVAQRGEKSLESKEKAADRKTDRDRISIKDKLNEKKAEVVKTELTREPVISDKVKDTVVL